MTESSTTKNPEKQEDVKDEEKKDEKEEGANDNGKESGNTQENPTLLHKVVFVAFKTKDEDSGKETMSTAKIIAWIIVIILIILLVLALLKKLFSRREQN